MTNGNEPIASIPDLNTHPSTWFGLTKREYIAALMLQAIVSHERFIDGESTPAERANLACIDADALIEALNKETK